MNRQEQISYSVAMKTPPPFQVLEFSPHCAHVTDFPCVSCIEALLTQVAVATLLRVSLRNRVLLGLLAKAMHCPAEAVLKVPLIR